MWKRTLIIVFYLITLSFFSCYRKNLKEITIEPSIERTLENIEKNRDYRHLVKYLYSTGAKIEYIEDKNINCILYDFNNKKISIPREFKNSENFLTLSVLKAIYIWKIHQDFNLDDLLVEEEILATLKQIHYIFESEFYEKDFKTDLLFNKYFKKEFCTYITLNTSMIEHLIVNKNSIINPKCKLPLEDIESQKKWIKAIKDSLENNTFFELMYSRDMQKVKKGSMTQAEAMKNDAMLRSKPLYEIYRDQRNFYDTSMEKIKKFEEYYKKEINYDTNWRKIHESDIENAKNEFSFCL